MKREFYGQRWLETGFMNYKELIERLRIDLDKPDLFVLDLRVPANEKEYQQTLEDMRVVLPWINGEKPITSRRYNYIPNLNDLDE